jgi:branched-chain amino acid transport system substrate-binding protein
MSARKRRSGISRRLLLQAGVLVSAYPAPQLLAQTSESLRIGFLTVLTGPLAAGGQQQEEGARLFLSERNGMIAGRKVELITQDTTGNPALAKTKTSDTRSRS